MLDLRTLLTDVSREQLANSRIAETVREGKAPAVWLGEPGATEAEITAAEQRLGNDYPLRIEHFSQRPTASTTLEPSSTSFTARQSRLVSCTQSGLIEAYQIGDDISPEEHLAKPEDSVRFRTAYLSSCLQISEEGDCAVVLLNPEVVNDEGEWEAWFFANWNPGARRCPSFSTYVDSELKRIRYLRDSKRQRDEKSK